MDPHAFEGARGRLSPVCLSERRVFKRPVDLALFLNRSKHNVQPFSFAHISSIKKYKEAGGGARGRIADFEWPQGPGSRAQRQGGKEKLKNAKAELLGFF